MNTNLEAAREVARQLRLRDIGGMIVIDFIDMLLEQNKAKVIDAMRSSPRTSREARSSTSARWAPRVRARVWWTLGGVLGDVPDCEGRGLSITYDVD